VRGESEHFRNHRWDTLDSRPSFASNVFNPVHRRQIANFYSSVLASKIRRAFAVTSVHRQERDFEVCFVGR
jgi:hypothetical protein